MLKFREREREREREEKARRVFSMGFSCNNGMIFLLDGAETEEGEREKGRKRISKNLGVQGIKNAAGPISTYNHCKSFLPKNFKSIKEQIRVDLIDRGDEPVPHGSLTFVIVFLIYS